jgi:hypothetical protein
MIHASRGWASGTAGVVHESLQHSSGYVTAFGEAGVPTLGLEGGVGSPSDF